jgi:hypothetical protein
MEFTMDDGSIPQHQQIVELETVNSSNRKEFVDQAEQDEYEATTEAEAETDHNNKKPFPETVRGSCTSRALLDIIKEAGEEDGGSSGSSWYYSVDSVRANFGSDSEHRDSTREDVFSSAIEYDSFSEEEVETPLPKKSKK